MYVGPETLMPLASALAAVAGVALMFWRKTVGAFRAGYGYLKTAASKIFPGGRNSA